MSDRGSAGVVMLAVAGLVAVLAMALAHAGVLFAARAQAQAAADAAALAAAPLTFRGGSPAAAAARFAAANGARLVRCRCPVDRSFATRIVAVEVARLEWVPVLGEVPIHAAARAEFVPAASYGEPISDLRSE